jgi:signal recognition particle receptor subunit beta
MAPRARRRAPATALKIVVTGPFGAGKTTLIRTISEITVLSTEKPVTSAGAPPQKTETTVAMDFGRITIDSELALYLFGTPGQDRFEFMWDILGEGMLGYLLLVDLEQLSALPDAANILAAFRRMAAVPYVVVVNRASELPPTAEAEIRARLGLDEQTLVVACDATDRESVKAVLLALLFAVLDSLDAAPAAMA